MDQISTFFDGKGFAYGPEMLEYCMSVVTLNWNSSRPNSDCGVYTMMSMLSFDGANDFNCDALRTVNTIFTIKLFVTLYFLFVYNLLMLIFSCFLVGSCKACVTSQNLWFISVVGQE